MRGKNRILRSSNPFMGLQGLAYRTIESSVEPVLSKTAAASRYFYRNDLGHESGGVEVMFFDNYTQANN
jgi:hypothetical protein